MKALIICFAFTFLSSVAQALPCEAMFDPGKADETGLVNNSADLTVENLANAYGSGAFPWKDNGDGTYNWFFPEQRGVLFLEDFRVSRSLRKTIRNKGFKVTFNQDFESVIRAARETHGGDNGSWISENFVKGYTEFHKAGYAHSVEVWNEDGELVGGLYGVFIDGMFAGESIFNRVSDAGKVALVALVESLKEQGHEMIDIQMVTGLLEQMGGVYISGEEFLKLKDRALLANRDFQPNI